MNLFTRSLRRRCVALLSLLPLFAGAACSDTTGVDLYRGYYDMTYFNGERLPAGDGGIYIRSGTIELRSGNTFRMEMDTDYLVDEEWETVPVSHAGNYSIRNGSLLLNTEDGPLTGTIFPDYIRVNDVGPGSIWEKRE